GVMVDRFWDPEEGGFYMTADDAEDLLVRQKDTYDGAMPSGNSIALLDLLRLSHLTGDPDLAQKAAELGQAFSGDVGKMPSGFTQMMSALDMAMGGGQEVVIVGDPEAPDTIAMLDALRRPFLPDKVVLLKTSDEGEEGIVRLAPFSKDHHQVDGKATAYVCRDHFCRNPTTDVQTMLDLLGV
ncbi:MAG: thioredoxin domain-containing protein, partial [Thermoplasmata archaeon]|nr:thioredoxin domain-containing protein [Thermoplasmata archaeon]